MVLLKKAWEEPLMGILLLLIVFFVSREAGIMSSQATAGAEKEEKKPVVVIDAGHGGNDPGKVAEFSTIKQFQPCRSKLVVKIRAGIRRAIGNLIGTIFQHQTDLRWGQVRGDRKMMLYPVDEIQQDPDAAIHGDAPGRGRFFIAVREEPF